MDADAVSVASSNAAAATRFLSGICSIEMNSCTSPAAAPMAAPCTVGKRTSAERIGFCSSPACTTSACAMPSCA